MSTPEIWDSIRDHYRRNAPAILAGPSDEWAIDAYAWEGTGIVMTPIEAWLWDDIREANVVMYPQLPVAGFFLDFANPVAKVGIECDGKAFHLDKEKDRARDEKLSSLGWTIYRITGSECRREYDEETGEKSPGRQLIEQIAERHPVKRLKNPNAGPKHISTWLDQIVGSLLEKATP